MLRIQFIFAAVILVLSGGGAYAQGGDEIVVTGARLQRYASDVVPVVALKRNADFVLVSYRFVCDTRDEAQRKRELSGTLENLLAAANKRKDIELSTLIEYEDDYDTLYFPTPYEKVDPKSFTPEYNRSDTSVKELVVKTPVSKNDTIEAAAERIEQFVKSVKKEGRTIAEEDDGAQLSVVGVERYRSELIAAIRADAQNQSTVLGASETEISGLEQVVRWERSGPLELKIYIPYKFAFTVSP